MVSCRPQDTGPQRQSGGALATIEGLLPPSGSVFRLLLEHLWHALPVVSESLPNTPGLPVLSQEILGCAVLLVLIVKRRHTLKCVKLQSQRGSARDEVCGIGSETIEPMTQDFEILRSPGLEISPP